MHYHTIFRRFLAIALTIVMALGMLPASATAQATAEDTSLSEILIAGEEIPVIPDMALLGTSPEAIVTTEAELTTIFQSGGTAILGADIILTAPLIVPLEKTVILDLNGYTIDRGLTGGTAAFNGNVITVNGSLTLEDSLGSGKITGGRKSGWAGGGGIYVKDGSLTMNGGCISGNTAIGNDDDLFKGGGNGGGVYINGGTFTMNNGAISDNKSVAGDGGGVYIDDKSTFIMSNGTIGVNEALSGGGVYVYDSIFTINGGTISGNNAIGTLIPVDGGGVVVSKGDGGGVNVHAGGVFTMYNGNISGNKARHDGGGVYAFLGGVIIMNAGSISNNDSVEAGGGIYFDKSFVDDYGVGTLTINGGEVCNNTTDTVNDPGLGGGVFVGNGYFSIINCKINGNQSIQGGGVFILAGTGVIENSEISENSATWQGGGVLLTNGHLDDSIFIGSLTTKSSMVNKNTAFEGGGVYVADGSFFTLESGQINENSTYAKDSMSDGGGVYVNTGSTFTMRGGEICGNATSTWYMYGNGGGVFVYDGSFKVSGNIKIQNNNRDSSPNNVSLHTDKQIIQIEGELTSADGTIGISTGNSKVAPLTVAQGEGYTLSEADLKKFARDNGGSLSLENNKITLPDPNASYLIYLSYNANGGSGSQLSSAILEGMDNNMTVASGDGFSRLNCTFTGWNTKADGSGTPYQPESKLILTVNTVLYAQWSIIKAELTVTAPQVGAAPIYSATCSPTGITTVLVWKQNGTPLTGNFKYNTVYSVEITLTAASGNKFSDAPEASVNGLPAVVQRNSDTELVVSYTFAKTNPRSAPNAALTQTTIAFANAGGSQPLALNAAGIAEGYNAVTWTMSKTEDSGNILTLPDITTGTVSNGAVLLGSFTIASNATGQPSKSAKVSIVFGGNESGDHTGVPISLTVTFQLAAGASPDVKLDYINEKIIDVSSVMEYIVTDSTGNPADWTGVTTVTGTEIPIGGMIPAAGSASKYIHIRYKGIAGSMPSNIEIPARPDLVAFFGDTWDSWVTYNIYTDVEEGAVYQDFGYRINTGADMINDCGDELDIWLNSGDTLAFWMPATESKFKSAEITVTAPPRLAKPSVAIDFSAGKLNTTADMEYRLSVAEDWITCTPHMDVTDFGWNGTEPVNVWLRYPCTDDNYASEAQTLIIPDAAFTTAKSAAQAANYDDMTQAEATDENAIKAALKSTAEVAVNNNSITITINKVSYTEPIVGTAAKHSGTNGSYTFTVTLSKGGHSDIAEQKTIIITATAYTGGNGGNENNGGSDGSDSYTPAPTVKPTEPVTGEAKKKATVDSNGTASIRITAQNITDAIANAKAEAVKNGVNAGKITVIINVSTDGKNASNLTVNLPKATQQLIISNKIARIELVIDRPDITVGINLAAVLEINRQANADVLLTVTKTDGSKLSSSAKKAIGRRPVYDFNASYQNKSKSVTDFGSGRVYVSIPYTPAKSEAIGYLYIVYVDNKGKPRRISDSAYDANSKSLIFVTNHFSVYGVGYKAPSAKFTDIGKHWAKDSIDYAVSKGLLAGKTKTTFSPNTAITHAVLAMALGKLAGVDTKAYTKNRFTDVKDDSPFRPYIEWAYSKGIIQGIGNGQFAPNRPVTREEIAAIFASFFEAMSYKLPVTRNTITIADASSITSGCADAVKSMQQAGIMMVEANNKFNPKANATRAEVSAMLLRYVKLTIQGQTHIK